MILFIRFVQIAMSMLYAAMSMNISTTDIVITAANAASVLVCLFAAILVFVFKLYKLVAYRLALYQVLSGLAFALVGTLKIIVVNYSENPDVYDRVCVAIGWLTMYCQWTKLLFTAWLAFHLFCFGVLHKNLNHFEALYVVTSLLVPAVMAAVPAITNTYGLSPLGGCYVYVQNDSHSIALIERFALWDGPAMAVLLVASAAMVVMVTALARIVCRRFKYEPMLEGDQFWKALRQLLPLAIFPMLFLMFMLPVFAVHVQLAQTPSLGRPLTLAASVFLVLWSMTSGAVLIAHITTVRCLSKQKSKLSITQRITENVHFSSHKVQSQDSDV